MLRFPKHEVHILESMLSVPLCLCGSRCNTVQFAPGNEDWLRQGFQTEATLPRQGRAAGCWRWKTAALVTLAVTVPLWAQQARVYREGNSWIEETTGTLPAAREVRVSTDLGSVKVQGNSQHISFTVRKRTFAASERLARRQFEQMRITSGKTGETAFLEGRLSGRNLNQFSAEFAVQVPRELDLVKVETRGGGLSFNSIAAPVVATTGAGGVKLDDLTKAVKITSGGGIVEGGNLGGDFTLTSGGGDVHINNVAGQAHVTIGGGRVYIGTAKASTIQTGAGGIEVRKCEGDLRASTDGGNLNFGDVYGSLRAETGGGSVRSGQRPGPGAGHHRRRKR